MQTKFIFIKTHTAFTRLKGENAPLISKWTLGHSYVTDSITWKSWCDMVHMAHVAILWLPGYRADRQGARFVCILTNSVLFYSAVSFNITISRKGTNRQLDGNKKDSKYCILCLSVIRNKYKAAKRTDSDKTSDLGCRSAFHDWLALPILMGLSDKHFHTTLL